MTWAPFRTCRRAMSVASSHFSSLTRFLNAREPMTLVRSPTISGRLASSHSTRSTPEKQVAVRFAGHLSRPLAGDHVRDGLDVLGRRAAAAADQIEPAVVDELFELGGERLRRLEVLQLLVRNAGVGITGHPRSGHLVDGPEVVGHELGTGRAVEPDRQQFPVGDRDAECIRGLTGEHRAHRLDGAGDHHRDLHAQIALELIDRQQRGFHVAGVLAGLDQQQIGAALDQRPGLQIVAVAQGPKVDVAGDGDRSRGGSHRAGDPALAGPTRNTRPPPCGRAPPRRS